jgi:hypothetical protein
MDTDLANRLKDLERRVGEIERRFLSAPNSQEPDAKPLSIQEFLGAKKPTTDVERTLFVAFYLEKFANVSPLNISDLKEAFGKAREPTPSNLNDAVNKNIQKGLIMEVDARKGGLKSWVLTTSGESLVTGRVPRLGG